MATERAVKVGVGGDREVGSTGDGQYMGVGGGLYKEVSTPLLTM